MGEKAIEDYLRLRVKNLGGKAYKFTSRGNAGVPDRIVVLPGGTVFFAELKAPGGKTTKLQDKKIAELEGLGCDVFVINSKESVDGILAICERMMQSEI